MPTSAPYCGFGEVMRRRLLRDRGHSSINQYAIQELGFSKSRTDDFVRLARQLENLPAIREAVESGALGYTKAREIVSVATPETQATWLKAARGTRQELVHEVKKVKRAAKVEATQGELLPSSRPLVAPKELPVRFQMDLTPEGSAAGGPGGTASQSGRRPDRPGRVNPGRVGVAFGIKRVTGSKVPPGALSGSAAGPDPCPRVRR